ncbi:MAG TPA: F0F1 ATP synthase subunit A, partial [Flavisolibacter sp.]
MLKERFKCLLVAVFSVFAMGLANTAIAQHEVEENTNNDEHYEAEDETGGEHSGKFDANEVIFGHVMDAHQYHFFTLGDFHATLPLPVILYEPGRGWKVFSSSRFHHGEDAYEGYRLVTAHYKEQLKKDGMKDTDIQLLSDESIIAVDEKTGRPLTEVAVYDFSLTRNVVQMFLALAILVWLLLSIAKKYQKGYGVTSAPKGAQNLMEPVITFIRDEVAKPNLGHKYHKYLPYLLTVFLFILINNIFGLIPGAANVTGNIAFTLVLGVISFVVILFSANKHYWGHIFWPPVPGFVKFIMIPVEILSIFTKPFALIIRLFANMLAGHIIIICLISLIFIFGGLSKAAGWGFSPISIGFAT